MDAIVEVDELVKEFNGKVRALDGLSLAVARGWVYGLLGPNGAGKTTLVRVLATLLQPDGGSARVAGIDVRADPSGVRARIGLAGQAAAVDELLTGWENLEMVGRLYGLPRRQARKRAAEILERIRLTEAAGRQVKTYSGGMRRRLDLAASLAGRPQVLLLDEPTAGLDPASRLDLWELIGDLVGGGTTVLLTTQYLEEAERLADRIAVIGDGRLLSEGTSDQLKELFGEAVVELRVQAEDQERILAMLRPFGGARPDADPRPGQVILPAPAGARTLRETLGRLETAGITPLDAALRRPTLDEVFLTLTGHATTNGDRHDGPADREHPDHPERAGANPREEATR